ncbi:MAG: hypothetical protein KF773_30310 [Deltaproteobacteria bacterium]|nr:hypothetical protein [Deltaproteobacteria bacterium]
MSPLIIGLIVAAVGVLLAAGGVFVRSRARRVLSVPLGRASDVSRATGGMASVEGAVRAQQPLAAPCTNTPCVYFHLTVEAKVKESRGGQTQTRWKKVGEHQQGSLFAVDDGSGTVLVAGQEGLDGELDQSFSGPPPGGPGLGVLASFIAPSLAPNEEVLAFKVTEKVVRSDGKLFALGGAQGGRISGIGNKKVLVSTRGRMAMVGSAKKKSLALFIAGALIAGAGATVMVLRPGEAPACGDLKDVVAECRIDTGGVVEVDRPAGADGTVKKDKVHRNVVAWEVTKTARYELGMRDPKKRTANPSIQVENSFGFPMNIDINIAIGEGAYSTKTKTTELKPGSYKIYLWTAENGPGSMLLTINELPPK